MVDTDLLYMASLEKRLDTCENYNKELLNLLREAHQVLQSAFFVNYKDTNASHNLFDRIKKFFDEDTLMKNENQISPYCDCCTFETCTDCKFCDSNYDNLLNCLADNIPD